MEALMTPSAVWEGYNPEHGELKTKLVSENAACKKYVFCVTDTNDGELIVDVRVYTPSFESKKTVLIVGEPSQEIQRDLLVKFVTKGYNVVMPDYSGVFDYTVTSFPKSLDYGYYHKGGKHLKKVCPTARDTSNYLYSVVIRRTITFINTVFPETEIIMTGIKGGGEIALQVAGTDDRLAGLALIGAAGYREYVDIPKYASNKEKEFVIDNELMCWLTGVSGTAYAKHIKVPVIIAVGSNGTISDIDRISNLMTLMSEAEVRLTVSNGYRDSINQSSFMTVLQWMDNVFIHSTPPELPTISVKINSEDSLYAEIKADCCIKIKQARIYYAFNDNKHSTRFWRAVAAEYTGEDEYIGKIPVPEKYEDLFAYAEVEYVNGLVLDGVVGYTNLRDKRLKTQRAVSNPIIFQYPGENSFLELQGDAVLTDSHICEGVLPVGLKGVYCVSGGMLTYAIGGKSGFDANRLLQIDSYSALKTYNLTIKLQKHVNGELVEYTAGRRLEAHDTFCSLRLNSTDFKDSTYKSMSDWNDIKSLSVCERNVIIGKIMFI